MEFKKIIEEKKKKIKYLKSKKDNIEENITEVKKELNEKTSLFTLLELEYQVIQLK